MTPTVKFYVSVVVFILLLAPIPFFWKAECVPKHSEDYISIEVAPPDWSSISYEDTLKFAHNASKETGIRPEFLVAILSQESSQGTDLGSCFLFDPKVFGKGVGIDFRKGKFTDRIMKPERDIVPFIDIMTELGRNPFFTPISCPMSIGYGGAMGPMQFIPSTWVLVKERTAVALNKKTVDPWNPEDAFMAAAILLQDLGADHGSLKSERNAACRYFSGDNCGEKRLVLVKKTKKGKPRHRYIYVENKIIARYGDSVMKKTAYFQKLLRPESIVKIKPDASHNKKAHKARRKSSTTQSVKRKNNGTKNNKPKK